nr:nucleoside triphosphate pyrophosphohydrolase [Bacillus sp. EB01]
MRDNIPEIIKKEGKTFSYKQLGNAEFIIELQKKAKEEWNEYLHSCNDNEAVEELADLLEVVYCLAATHGISEEDLDETRRRKAEIRGSFNNKIFLIDVEE